MYNTEAKTQKAEINSPLANIDQQKLAAPQELNLEQIEEVSGGIIPALVGAAYVGLVGYALWSHKW